MRNWYSAGIPYDTVKVGKWGWEGIEWSDGSDGVALSVPVSEWADYHEMR